MASLQPQHTSTSAKHRYYRRMSPRAPRPAGRATTIERYGPERAASSAVTDLLRDIILDGHDQGDDPTDRGPSQEEIQQQDGDDVVLVARERDDRGQEIKYKAKAEGEKQMRHEGHLETPPDRDSLARPHAGKKCALPGEICVTLDRHSKR